MFPNVLNKLNTSVADQNKFSRLEIKTTFERYILLLKGFYLDFSWILYLLRNIEPLDNLTFG